MAKNDKKLMNLDLEMISEIIENMPGVVVIYDVVQNNSRELIYISPGFEELVGEKTAKKIHNRPDVFFSLIKPQYKISLEKEARKAINEKKQLDYIYPILSDDGEIWIRVRLNWNILSESKIRWSGIIFNVTQQVHNEKKLKESQSHLHSLIEDASDLIWENDVHGTYLDVNNSFRKIMGYKNEEVIGKNSINFVHPQDKKKSIENFRSVIKGNSASYEVRCISSNNKILYFWIKLRPIFKGGKVSLIQGMARDVTERLKAEQIREITYSITEKQTNVNNLTEFAEIIRSQLSKIMNTDNFYLAIYNEKLDRYNFPYYKDVTEIVDPNKMFILHNTITDYVRKNAQALLLNTENQDQFFQKNEIDLQGTDSPCWIGAPIMDELKHKAIGVIVVQSYENANEYDMEDLKALEFVALNLGRLILRKLDEIKEKNINQQLSLITKILRHDLTNDLVVIKSALKLFKKSGDSSFLDEVGKKINKGIELINQMRDQEDFAAENRNLTPFNLNRVFNKIIPEYHNCQIILTGKANIFADQSIFSIFHNIISNAINHGKANKIEISISTEERKCIVRITNNGKKIPDDISDKIFNEGFSNKKSSTGMGLYIISKTLENYHGTIFLENNLKNNVSFILIFPKAIDR